MSDQNARAWLAKAYNLNFADGLHAPLDNRFSAIVYAILLVGLALCEAIAARGSDKGERVERA
jgi:hypothetical protein